eukprot:1107238-Pelagomonas_calceolata.AAC.1
MKQTSLYSTALSTNTHVSGLINNDLNVEPDPPINTYTPAGSQPNSTLSTQIVPSPQPCSTSHYRHEHTGRRLRRDQATFSAPTANIPTSAVP